MVYLPTFILRINQMWVNNVYISGQMILFHQPRFPWNKGISISQLPFSVRSCEVAIIWPDIYIYMIAGSIMGYYKNCPTSGDQYPGYNRDDPSGSPFWNPPTLMIGGKQKKIQVSNEKRGLPWLFLRIYRGWTTAQFYGAYNIPLWGSLLNNQDSMASKAKFVS